MNKLAISMSAICIAAILPFATFAGEHGKVQLWAGGPYWATTNIGAEKPWEYGYYFWWGDTVGYKRMGSSWVASDGSSFNFAFTENGTSGQTFNKSNAILQSEGWITTDGVLAPEHDAAHVKWGSGWRMPTKQELADLINMCNWTWTTMNGVKGFVFRGRDDYASASIFVPCAGAASSASSADAYDGAGTYLGSVDYSGQFWSSFPDYSIKHACCLCCIPSSRYLGYPYRCGGLPIRPVQGVGEKFFSVFYNANGGNGAMNLQSCDVTETLKLSANKFTRNGYVFQGWATSLEQAVQGIVDYADEAKITVDSDMTLYAVWDNPALTLEAESADWSHGSITLRCEDADSSGAAHSYSLFYEDENGCTNAVEETGAANVSVSVDGFAHLTDSGFSFRLGGIPPVKYFVKDENGRWSAECVTRNRHLLSVGFDSYKSRWQKGLRQALTDAAEIKRLCEMNGEFQSSNTRLLRNSEATTNEIRNAMTDFADRTQPGDLFVFYIATHGGDYSTSKQARLCAYDTYYSVSALQADIRKFDSGVAVVCVVMACHSASMTGGEDDFSDRINQWLVACGFAQCLGNVAWIASCESTQSSYNTANYTMFGQSFIDDGFGGGYADGNLYGVDFDGNAYEGGNSDGIITFGELGRYAGAFAKGKSDKEASNVKLENDWLLDRIVLGRRTASSSLRRPGRPTSPSATQGDTRIDISWTASGNSTSYRIYRYPLDAPGEWEWIGISGRTIFRDETAMLTREYGYRIMAVNPVGVSDLSDVAVGSRRTSKILEFLGSFFGTTTASAEDYDAMEKAVAPNGITYGASYVAGLNPTNETAKFTTTIAMDANGKPVVSWSPDLNEGGTKSERIYRVLGSKSLDASAEWDDITDIADPDAEGYRFFKVSVEMP